MQAIKILYVEDEPFLGKIVKESLESRNFTVKMIDDGQLVLNAFYHYQPDICILDVMLPNVDGFTIGKEIKENNPNMPIIYLTAKSQTDDLLEGFRSGGNDYIKKPFSIEELIVRIQNLLSLSAVSSLTINPEHSIHLGAYTFYPLKYKLDYKGSSKKLSHRETKILKILCAHQNKPVDRKEILLKIWGDNSYFNSRNLDVYIKKIRNYLAKDSTVKIVTLKGIGYHFSVGN